MRSPSPAGITQRTALGLAIPVLATMLSLSSPTGAQPPPPPAPKPAQPVTMGPQAAPNPAPPAAAQQPATTAAPAPIDVNDPMLAPLPAPPKMLTSWKDALGLIQLRSIDLQLAMQDVERAEGQARVALAAALPTLTASGNLSHQLITGSNPGSGLPFTNPSLTASVTASVPLLAPRAWYGIETAKKSVESAKLTVEDKKRTIFAGVANSIVSVVTAERVAEINRNSLKSALERLDLARRKFRLGDGTRLDVLRAEQDAAQARSLLVSGDESLRQAREALGLALGFHDAYGVPSNISLNDIEATVRQVCSPGPLEDRADIKKSRNDIEIAKRGITDVWLQFSPTATISSTASLQNQTQVLSGHPGAWNIQGVLTIPLWEGGARYGNLRIAKAQAEQAKLGLEATLRGTNITVAQALRSVAVAEQARAVSESARDLAREAARLAQRAYEVGTGTSFDLVDTAKAQRAAELDLAVKEFQVIQAKLTALLATSNCAY
jgi:outer membrane protein TolC